jgi:hypothetical protein
LIELLYSRWTAPVQSGRSASWLPLLAAHLQWQQHTLSVTDTFLRQMGGTCSMSPVSFLAASTSCSSAEMKQTLKKKQQQTSLVTDQVLVVNMGGTCGQLLGYLHQLLICICQRQIARASITR